IELNGSIINQPNIAVAGWNRGTTAATNGVSIHHPSGDAKKISIFTTAPARNDNYTLFNGLDVVGDQHWVAAWTFGVTEGGSSGSPLVDQNQRIVGQLAGGNSFCNSPVQDDGYGRFDNSWTGGGTNATRLSNWLGGTTPPTTLNKIRSPWINPTTSPSIVCTTNKGYTLNHPIPGRTVTWT